MHRNFHVHHCAKTNTYIGQNIQHLGLRAIMVSGLVLALGLVTSWLCIFIAVGLTIFYLRKLASNSQFLAFNIMMKTHYEIISKFPEESNFSHYWLHGEDMFYTGQLNVRIAMIQASLNLTFNKNNTLVVLKLNTCAVRFSVLCCFSSKLSLGLFFGSQRVCWTAERIISSAFARWQHDVRDSP